MPEGDVGKRTVDMERIRNEIKEVDAVEQLITMGATQAWQQLAFIQTEISRACGGQHQPTPATQVHIPQGRGGGDEDEEEQIKRGRRAAKLVSHRRGEAVMRGFRFGSGFDPSTFSRNAGEGNGDEFTIGAKRKLTEHYSLEN